MRMCVCVCVCVCIWSGTDEPTNRRTNVHGTRARSWSNPFAMLKRQSCVGRRLHFKLAAAEKKAPPPYDDHGGSSNTDSGSTTTWRRQVGTRVPTSVLRIFCLRACLFGLAALLMVSPAHACDGSHTLAPSLNVMCACVVRCLDHRSVVSASG